MEQNIISNAFLTGATTVSGSVNFSGAQISGIYKRHVGLGLVDNTSDIDKPISTATTQAILTAKREILGDITYLGNKPAIDTMSEIATNIIDICGNTIPRLDASLNAKADLSGCTFTGRVNIINDLSVNGIVNIKDIKIWYGNNDSTNIAIGNNAFNSTTTGNNNTAVGNLSLNSNTSGSLNTALGYQSLKSNTTGSYNTALGRSALEKNTTGGNITACGQAALISNTTGSFNTALGKSALEKNTTGGNNVAVGSNALLNDVSSNNNVAIGTQSLYNHTAGSSNCAFGYRSLYLNKTASSTISVGDNSFYNLLDGTANLGIGSYVFSEKKTGNNNSGIGLRAGANDISGNNNTFLGAYSNVNSTLIINNSTAIGYNAKVTESNQIVLGTSSEIVSIPGNIIYSFLSINPDTSGSPGTKLIKGYSIFYTTGMSANSYVFIDASNCILGNTIKIFNTSTSYNLYVSTHIAGDSSTFIGKDSAANNNNYFSVIIPSQQAISFTCVNASLPVWLVGN
jgi:hypothetical protein